MSEVIINKTRYECPPAVAAYIKELKMENARLEEMIDEQPKDEVINDARYHLGMYIEHINEEIDKAKQCIARQEGILSALKIEYIRFCDIRKILEEGAKMDGDERE
jgi:hypothetical protein